jgi:GNAT superfamily N-acetyltransferase
MPDMLVRLYDLPPLDPVLDRLRQHDVVVRPALALEKPTVLAWVSRHYQAWTGEVDVCFARLPVSCHVAVRSRELLGFACHDAAGLNLFGPMAVAESARQSGIGRKLLLSVLHAQKAQGYAYAIIGAVGPAAFYARTVDAVPIPGSETSVYGPVKRNETIGPSGGQTA